MHGMRLIRVGLILILTAACFHAVAKPNTCSFDKFPKPGDMETQPLMSGVVYNGVPLSVQTFKSTSQPDSILKFYKKRWKDMFAENQVDWWIQVLHVDKQCIYQVQVAAEPDGKAYGRLILTPMGRATAPKGAGIQLPDGAKVLTDMVSDDGAKKGRTLVVVTSQPVAAVLAFYQSRLKSQGWGIEMQQDVSGNPVLVAVNGASRLSLVMLSIRGGTHLLYNEETIAS